ncbi:S-layer homology domain-containing protein [Paenibacillus alba]|uniref:S-layer homology domain-containing protein n=1 Tax=Paenibacillus alba TaxID=1197127 RepID=UPI001563C5B6|nr:S-layer homology domain-containing protein [Paenibacillus alba]NQX69040.1 S-layer homology domain-containing protein [Paenibacillus alba]
MIRIHKLISFLLVAAMLIFSLLPQFASAASPVSFSLTILNDKPISVGDEIQVAVMGINLVDTYAYEVNLDFDPSRLEFKPKSDNTKIPGFRVPAIVDTTEGHLQFAHSRIGAVPGDNGDIGLLNLTFIAKESGTASIEIKSVKLVDSQTDAIEPLVAGVKKSLDIYLSAATVASSLTSIAVPAKDGTEVALPSVPEGFTLAIKSSSNTDVIVTNGTIVPPVVETTVNLVLEVTRISDGTKASTVSIPVKVPAKSTQVSPGGGGGGGGGAPISTPDPKTEQDGIHVVTLGEISKPAENGKVVIRLSGDVKQITLPSNSAQLLGQNQLEIKTDKLTLDVPADLIRQLTSGLSTETLKDSTISLLFEPLSVSTAKDVIAKGQTESQAAIKLIGDVYEFKLSVTKADGSTAAVLSKFDQSITIRIKVDASVNPKLAGIYYIADDGKLEYIGGQYSNGEMVAQISHFSKYAVLEVTKTFSDVSKDHWAGDVIKELAAKQLVNGTSATTFEPERSVTRAEFTTLLVRALKLTGTGQPSFADVKSSDWYAEAIAIAVKAGVVNGESEAVFDPNAQITREEMVTMMMRAYAVTHGSQPTGHANTVFTDESQFSSWAAAFVNQAAELHLVQGRQDGIFEPQGITSRAEAAQVIYNLLNK